MRGKSFSYLDAKVCIDAMNESVPLDVANARFTARYGLNYEENERSLLGEARVSKSSVPQTDAMRLISARTS